MSVIENLELCNLGRKIELYFLNIKQLTFSEHLSSEIIVYNYLLPPPSLSFILILICEGAMTARWELGWNRNW